MQVWLLSVHSKNNQRLLKFWSFGSYRCQAMQCQYISTTPTYFVKSTKVDSRILQVGNGMDSIHELAKLLQNALTGVFWLDQVAIQVILSWEIGCQLLFKGMMKEEASPYVLVFFFFNRARESKGPFALLCLGFYIKWRRQPSWTVYNTKTIRSIMFG